MRKGVSDRQVKRALKRSGLWGSFVKPGKISVVHEHGNDYAIVEDNGYQVEEPDSRRTFVVVDAAPGVDGSGIDFEEL